MNENIKRLAIQAGMIVDTDRYGIAWAEHMSVDAMVKLVHLAVEESARIAELKEQGYRAYLEDISVGYYIRENFGIEQ